VLHQSFDELRLCGSCTTKTGHPTSWHPGRSPLGG